MARLDSMTRDSMRWAPVALLLVVIVGATVAARSLGFSDVLRLENLAGLRQWTDAYGGWAPVLFIAGYALAELLFVPALPITVLGGLLFGAVWGTLYVSIGATIGAALAFLAARYGTRGIVQRWIQASPRLLRIDDAVAQHGWRILMVTRLVPLFPFNLQNFAYGLTRIRFQTFVWVSWLCMLPGTAAYTLTGGALSEGLDNRARTLASLGLAGLLVVTLSLLPGWLRGRSRTAAELLSPE